MAGVDMRTMQSDKIVCNDLKFMGLSFFLLHFYWPEDRLFGNMVTQA
jgi:hypothetical protein